MISEKKSTNQILSDAFSNFHSTAIYIADTMQLYTQF